MQGFFSAWREKRVKWTWMKFMSDSAAVSSRDCILFFELRIFLLFFFFVDFQFLFFLCRVECVNMFEEVWLIAHSSIQFFFSNQHSCFSASQSANTKAQRRWKLNNFFSLLNSLPNTRKYFYSISHLQLLREGIFIVLLHGILLVQVFCGYANWLSLSLLLNLR